MSFDLGGRGNRLMGHTSPVRLLDDPSAPIYTANSVPDTRTDAEDRFSVANVLRIPSRHYAFSGTPSCSSFIPTPD